MHAPFNRRRVLLGLAAAAAAGSLPTAVLGAMGPNDKFDLLIKGRRSSRSEPEPARHARHRHPQRRDRGRAAGHSGQTGRSGC